MFLIVIKMKTLVRIYLYSYFYWSGRNFFRHDHQFRSFYISSYKMNVYVISTLSLRGMKWLSYPWSGFGEWQCCRGIKLIPIRPLQITQEKAQIKQGHVLHQWFNPNSWTKSKLDFKLKTEPKSIQIIIRHSANQISLAQVLKALGIWNNHLYRNEP